jgi:hypothetical protein
VDVEAEVEMATEGKEPGNWELYRGIVRIESAVHEIGRNSLSAAVFAVEKQALTNRIDGVTAEQIALKAAQLANETALDNYSKDHFLPRPVTFLNLLLELYRSLFRSYTCMKFYF